MDSVMTTNKSFCGAIIEMKKTKKRKAGQKALIQMSISLRNVEINVSNELSNYVSLLAEKVSLSWVDYCIMY